MQVALIAHDEKKNAMIAFARKNKKMLEECKLFATGTTGKLIREKTGLSVIRFLSGPLGGDAQISAMVASEKIDLVIFLRDPLTSQPHEPDILALLRICDVHNVPLATNITSAELLLYALIAKETPWQDIQGRY